MTIILPEDGAVRAETCRRDLTYNNIYMFNSMCAFNWHTKDMVTIP